MFQTNTRTPLEMDEWILPFFFTNPFTEHSSTMHRDILSLVIFIRCAFCLQKFSIFSTFFSCYFIVGHPHGLRKFSSLSLSHYCIQWQIPLACTAAASLEIYVFYTVLPFICPFYPDKWNCCAICFAFQMKFRVGSRSARMKIAF